MHHYLGDTAGIVMFASLWDRHMYISTGRHAKAVLTDSLATNVFERMKAPHSLPSFALLVLIHSVIITNMMTKIDYSFSGKSEEQPL